MSPNLIAPIVIAPLVVWQMYYRMRRNFGRQPIRPGRMWTRVGLLCGVSMLVALAGIRDPRLAEGLALGLLGGAVLGIVALRLTRFEIDGVNDCYFPNVWIGLALTTLLVGRLLYRFMVAWPGMSNVAAGGAYASLQHSPLTLGIVGLLFGYYIAYYAGLLLHHRRARMTIASNQPS
ncbi:MAG TPA: DUF1453 domain-containing protein [Rhodanobacteraceae bacterium]|jgi:hypothetical protein|nr:DUF1453 domain-containing protein [Rhodanobacteraceae bacterium]